MENCINKIRFSVGNLELTLWLFSSNLYKLWPKCFRNNGPASNFSSFNSITNSRNLFIWTHIIILFSAIPHSYYKLIANISLRFKWGKNETKYFGIYSFYAFIIHSCFILYLMLSISENGHTKTGGLNKQKTNNNNNKKFIVYFSILRGLSVGRNVDMKFLWCSACLHHWLWGRVLFLVFFCFTGGETQLSVGNLTIPYSFIPVLHQSVE